MSRGRATIWWLCLVLRGRRGMSVGGGIDGTLGEIIRAACCEMAPQAETTRVRAHWQPLSWHGQAPYPFWVWCCMKRTVARGRGQSPRPITLPLPKPPEKGCHPVHCHSHRTNSCRSQPWRDADHVEWRGPSNALPVVTARHAGIEPEHVRLRLLESSALLFHRTLGRREWEDARGGVAMKRKLSASAERWDWNSRNESSQSCWAQSITQRDHHQHAGEPCTPYNDGAAFAITA